MIILDASVWIALLDSRDSQHEKSRRACAQLTGQKVLTEYVATELATVLMHKGQKERAVRFISSINAMEDGKFMPSSPHLFTRTLQFFSRNNDEQLSFTDCSLAVLSSEYQVVTFDTDLKAVIEKKE